jgi:hypothetical protein
MVVMKIFRFAHAEAAAFGTGPAALERQVGGYYWQGASEILDGGELGAALPSMDPDGYSHWLRVYGLAVGPTGDDPADIPNNAVIRGIIFNMTGYPDSPDAEIDAMNLRDGYQLIGQERSPFAAIPSTGGWAALDPIGAEDDDWGVLNFTGALIKQAAFGVFIGAHNQAWGETQIIGLNDLLVKVYYEEIAGGVVSAQDSLLRRHGLGRRCR